MDLSKLPKFGGERTDPPSADAPTDPRYLDGRYPDGPPIHSPQPLEYGVARRPGGFAEAWLAVAIGVILLLMSPRLFQYLFAPARFAQSYNFNDGKGNPLAYTQTVFFWGDIVVVAFALTLIAEGIVLGFARRVIWVVLAIAFTAIVAAANLVYLVAMMWSGYGLQLYSAVAVALGVYGCVILAHRRRELSPAIAY